MRFDSSMLITAINNDSPHQKLIDRALMWITTLVIGAHLLFFIFSLIFNGPSIKVQKPPERLIVKTINLNESAQATVTRQEPKKQAAIPKAKVSEPAPPATLKKELPKESSEIIQKETPVKPKEELPKPEIKPEVKPQKKIEAPKEKAPVKPKPAPQKKPAVKPQSKPSANKPKKTIDKKSSEKKPAAKSAPKKEIKIEPKKTAPSTPKPDPKAEAAQAKRRELIANAQKSIGNIDSTRGKVSASKTTVLAATGIPSRIESLQIESLSSHDGPQLSKHEQSYYDELGGRLKLLLRLPEFGEVKVKLTLERSGKFSKVAIVSAKSASNRSYLEKTLPTLKYPSFGNNFGTETQYTFVITLSNEM